MPSLQRPHNPLFDCLVRDGDCSMLQSSSDVPPSTIQTQLQRRQGSHIYTTSDSILSRTPVIIIGITFAIGVALLITWLLGVLYTRSYAKTQDYGHNLTARRHLTRRNQRSTERPLEADTELFERDSATILVPPPQPSYTQGYFGGRSEILTSYQHQSVDLNTMPEADLTQPSVPSLRQLERIRQRQEWQNERLMRIIHGFP